MVDQILMDIESKGYSYQPNLLNYTELQAINYFFEINKRDFKPALVGPTQNRRRLETVRGDFSFWIDPISPPEVFHKQLSFLNTLKQGINEKFYLGLKEFECHLAYYPPGAFYTKHSDRFESSSTRSLSFVFYLNERWEKEDGGELLLFNKTNELLESFTPTPGGFTCFLSEEFPHEVKSGKIERRSFTGWMHTKILY